MYIIHFRTEISGDFSFECLERLKPDRKKVSVQATVPAKVLIFHFYISELTQTIPTMR